MPVKIFGCVLVLIGSCTYGVCKGAIRRLRISQLIELKNTFILMAGEIRYGYATMEEIFKNISRQYEDDTGEFYRYMYGKIKKREYTSLSDMWEEACRFKLTNTYLDSGDIEFIKEYGKLPVHLDKSMQIQFIDEKNLRLEELIVDAKEKIETQCRIYKVLSATVGLFIVLILI